MSEQDVSQPTPDLQSILSSATTEVGLRALLSEAAIRRGLAAVLRDVAAVARGPEPQDGSTKADSREYDIAEYIEKAADLASAIARERDPDGPVTAPPEPLNMVTIEVDRQDMTCRTDPTAADIIMLTRGTADGYYLLRVREGGMEQYEGPEVLKLYGGEQFKTVPIPKPIGLGG